MAATDSERRAIIGSTKNVRHMVPTANCQPTFMPPHPLGSLAPTLLR